MTISRLCRASGLLAALCLCLSGCFRFDFGDGDIEGCGIDPDSIADRFEDRYALGSALTLSTDGLSQPTVTSSDTEVVRVSAIIDERVTFLFVGAGVATITVTNDGESATKRVTVAPHERYEVVLPSYGGRLVPLAEKAVIDPTFEVVYLDAEGRLYGAGLADTTWERASGGGDWFSNHSLPSGPAEVEVTVGNRTSVISFEVVHAEEVSALWLLETDLGDRRIRVDLVGLTSAGTQVWNIAPYFEVEGRFYFGWFDYIYVPETDPSLVIAESIPLSVNGPLQAVEKSIHAAETFGTGLLGSTEPARGSAPLFASASLLLIALGVRIGSRARG